MLTLAKAAELYFRDYVRGGGKQNRKAQVARMTEFLDWAESNQKVYALGGLGKRHVINFWKAHRDFSDKTAYGYWLAIRQLWVWLDKHDVPPEPYKQRLQETSPVAPVEPKTGTGFTELSSAIAFAREAQNLSVQKLANMTGVEVDLIQKIERGDEAILSATAQVLVRTLSIQYSIKTTNKN